MCTHREPPRLNVRQPPWRRGGFSLMAFIPRYLRAADRAVAVRPTTRSRPRLGLAARSRHITTRTPASGASATGPVSRRATSAPSHRAGELPGPWPGPQAPGRQARLVNCPHRPHGSSRARFASAMSLCLRALPSASSRRSLTRTLYTLHRAPVGQGLLPSRPARAFGFWSLRALAKARRGRVYV